MKYWEWSINEQAWHCLCNSFIAYPGDTLQRINDLCAAWDDNAAWYEMHDFVAAQPDHCVPRGPGKPKPLSKETLDLVKRVSNHFARMGDKSVQITLPDGIQEGTMYYSMQVHNPEKPGMECTFKLTRKFPGGEWENIEAPVTCLEDVPAAPNKIKPKPVTCHGSWAEDWEFNA